MTGDRARFVAGKEQQDICNVDGHTRRDGQIHMLGHLPHHVGVQGFGVGRHRHRRDNRAGVDRVATDTRTRETECGVLG